MAENKISRFKFLEPFGHINRTSKLERYWEKFDGCFSLIRNRTKHLSVYEGMSHSPMQYELKNFELNQTPPTQQWTELHLLNLIKTEFEERVSEPSYGYTSKTSSEKSWSLTDEEVMKFVRNSEWTNRIPIPEINENSFDDVAKAIYDILCNPKIGNSKNKANNNPDEFSEFIIPKLKTKNRLLFVILGFPFKDQNKFRVPYDANNFDYSEVSLLLRLFTLTQTIYQVHPYGVDILILTDGDIYQQIFGVDKKKVNEYQDSLINYRNKLNLQGAISFITLGDLIKKASNRVDFESHLSHIKKDIASLVTTNKDLAKKFSVLKKAMKWNLNNKTEFFEGLSDSEILFLLTNDKKDTEDSLQKKWNAVDELATNTALEYAAINIAIKYHDLIQNFFPESIRATVHPKQNQFALTSSQNSFPWNGVAYSKKWPLSAEDIRNVPFSSIASDENLTSYKFPQSEQIAFYSSGMKNPSINIAKSMFKEKWMLEELEIKSLNWDDLEAFVQAGENDQLYSWERTNQSKEYYSGLLQHRLSHYSKYGFGIQAVWDSGKIIGQFGLQVLDKEMDRIEIVLFLKQNFRNKGYGYKLFQYILNRCKSNGLNEVYGVIRSENEEAKMLINKFPNSKIGIIKHFKEQGIMYEFKL